MVTRRTLALFLLAFFLAAPSPGAEPSFDAARRDYERLSGDAKAFSDPESWRKLGLRFERAARGEHAAEALYEAGLCAERAERLAKTGKDEARALSFYALLADKYRDSAVADDALFRNARLFENLGEIDRAEGLYRRILTEHPDGDMAEIARRRLPELRKTVELKALRHWSGPAYTRIVADLSGLAPYEAGALKADGASGKSPRIFVDLKRARTAPDCQDCREVSDGLVTRVRAARFGKDTVRLVLDLNAPATFRVFPLLDPYRLVIDVFRETPERAPSGDPVASLIRGSGGAAPSGGEPGKGLRNGRRLRIVLDPGHGGKDSGAVGPGGTEEKDVTLAMAKAIARKLRERMGCDIFFTRDRDSTLTLSNRTATANALGADLFLSVHANAAPTRQSRGIETYYLDRSSDRSAMRVAALENMSSEAGIRETDHLLADILLNMKLPESRRLAQTVQAAMLGRVAARHGPVRDLGVKRAPFYVLTGAVMPAVLLETAFISNPEEEKWLTDPAFHETVADAVSAAVMDFF